MDRLALYERVELVALGARGDLTSLEGEDGDRVRWLMGQLDSLVASLECLLMDLEAGASALELGYGSMEELEEDVEIWAGQIGRFRDEIMCLRGRVR